MNNQSVAFWCHHGGKILMHIRTTQCRDYHNTWDCGGGGVDEGETYEQALARELQEEYCLEPQDYIVQKKVGVTQCPGGDGEMWDIHCYLCNVLVPEKVRAGEPHKAEQLTWFAMDELPFENMHPGVKDDMENFWDEIKAIVEEK